MATEDLQERMTRLESHLAHIEYQYDQLNQVVLDQQKVLQKTRALLDQLLHTLPETSFPTPSPPQKPPHY